MEECPIGEHDFEVGAWYHLVGTESSYRDNKCKKCPHVEIEGRGIFDTREEDPEWDTMDLDEVEVRNGRIDAMQSVGDALRELSGI